MKKRKKFKKLFRRILFLCMLLVFVVSLGMIILRILDYQKGDAIYQAAKDSVFHEDTTATKTVTIPVPKSVKESSSSTDSTEVAGEAPTEEETVTMSILTNYDHNALLAINQDAVGYLQIPAIGVLLPVVQGSDNDFYLRHAITGANSQNGTLFIDTRCSLGVDSPNTIVYGHNMQNGAMFGKLSKFMDASFFQNGTNRYFYFYVQDHIYMYEIYSVHVVDATSHAYHTNFTSGEEFIQYLNDMHRASYHSTTSDFSESSITMTLSTCTNDSQKRFLVQGLRIGEIFP